jgi:hypothetical protein
MRMVEVPSPSILAPIAFRQRAKIDHFRLTGGIDDFGFALGQGRRHHDGVGGTDGNTRKFDPAAGQTTRRLHNDITALDFNVRTERLQALDKEVHRPRADRTAAGQRNAGFVHPGNQRADNPEAGPHLGHKLIGRRRVDDLTGSQVQGLAGQIVLTGALAIDRIINAMVGEDLHQLGNVAQARHIRQRQGFVGQQGRNHQGQCGVLCAGNRNDAVQLRAAGDFNAVHVFPRTQAANPRRSQEFLSKRCDLHATYGPCKAGHWRSLADGASSC